MAKLDEASDPKAQLRQAYDRIETLERRLDVALESARAAIYETDYATGTLWTSANFAEVVGREMNFDDVNERIWACVHPDDVAVVDAADVEMTATGSIVPIDARFLDLQGQTRWCRSFCRMDQNSEGSLKRVTGLILDFDEHKRLEFSLIEAKRDAQEANKTKSEFLANMSHEIRTPMNGIMGMNTLLLRSELTAEQRKFAEAVKVSADCLLTLINDILDLSKLEAGKVEIEDVDFSLQTVVEDVVELLSPRAIEKDLEIASYVDDDARKPLKGDPTRLRQILLNLLSNALKFTDSGFVAVEVTSRPNGDQRTRLRIEVHDTGIGLTPEAKAKLFQKFQQADGSITRRYGGTGLGLSICRQLVELMDGQIGVEDRLRGGSTFWFEISLGKALSIPVAPLRETSDLKGVKVLVVDDIELNRTIFARQMRDEGAIVVESSSGQDALAAVERSFTDGEPFDILLIDHMMPDLAGDEVAEQIRSRLDWRQPKLVLASSIGKPLSTDRAAKVGFDAFLTKPVRHHVLVNCLAALLRGSASASDETMAKPTARPLTDGSDRFNVSPTDRSAFILLAEDNQINIQVALGLLEGEGYAVHSVSDGVDAVEAASAHHYDLILMDVQMPRMDGIEATRRIKALPGRAAAIPIVAMTANAMRSDVQACMEAGMIQHVSKPIDPEAFLKTVKQILAADGAAAARVESSEPDALTFDNGPLEGFRRMLAAARFADMVESFLTGTRQCLDRLPFLVRDQNFAALMAEAHDLKSTSGTFGARRLQFLAAELEIVGRDKDANAIKSLLPLIQEAGETVLDLIISGRDFG